MACRALLCDLDGVLVDSRRTIELIWRTWAASRGVDAARFLRVAHGRRIAETLRLVAPDVDVAREVTVLDRMEQVETRGLAAAAGATALVHELEDDQWAIVTSGSRAVATLRLATVGLAVPSVFITASDVTRGKPDPEGYRIAAERLKVRPGDCVVLEDSPPGLAAGKAAGIRVIALLTTHTAAQLGDADARVGALSDIEIRPGAAGSAGFVVHYRAVTG
jgi:sugar-phosphatase